MSYARLISFIEPWHKAAIYGSMDTTNDNFTLYSEAAYILLVLSFQKEKSDSKFEIV
jgi:hypothetical protein